MKTYKELIIESTQLRLKDIATIKVGLKDADFWIKRRDSIDQVGAVTKIYNKEAFGIKVERSDIMIPDFLYYAMMNIHMQGYYKGISSGSTGLVNIKINDIKNVKIG